MNKDFEYEQAKIEIMIFDTGDIITTSGQTNKPLGGKDDWGDIDYNGWT